jgi:hypothetical protein
MPDRPSPIGCCRSSGVDFHHLIIMLISRRPPPIRLTLPKHTLLPSYFTRRYATSNNVEEPHTTSDPKKYAHTLLFPTTSLPQRPKWESLRKEYGEKTMGELYQWQVSRHRVIRL